MNLYIITLIIFIIGILFLYFLNYNKSQRYRQCSYPIYVFVWGMVVYGLYYFNDKTYSVLLKYIDIFHQTFNLHDYDSLPEIIIFLHINSIILLCYGAFKLLIRIIHFFVDQWGPKKDISRFSSFAYEFDNQINKFSLKPEWVHIKSFLKGISFISIFFYIYVITGYVYPDIIDTANCINFPVLQVLFLVELIWYLGGEYKHEQELKPSEIREIEKEIKERKNISALWNSYPKKHKLSEIIEFKSENNDTVSPVPITSNFQMELDIIAKNLKENENISIYIKDAAIKEDGFAVLNSLWKNEDVLISCPTYERVAPFIFASLQRDILEQKKIICLIDAFQSTNNNIEDWIHRWMKETIFAQVYCNISTEPTFKINKIDYEDIWVTSVRELLKREWHSDGPAQWLEQLKTVVVFNIQNVIYPDIQAAATLFQKLSDTTQKKLQIILLTTEKRRNTASSIREYLTALPYEFHLSNFPEESIHLKVWSFEDAMSLRKNSFSSIQQDISPEISLCVPALEGEQYPGIIHLSGGKSTPWKDSIEHYDIHSQKRKAINAVMHHEFAYIDIFGENELIIALDYCNNIISTLNSIHALQRTKSFVHIICPPYMLRDYLCDNLNFFQSKYPDSLITLSPTLMRNTSNTAIFLFDRLLENNLFEDEINMHMNRIAFYTEKETKASDKKFAVEDRLIELFDKLYGKSNYFDQLEMTYEDIFIRDTFQKKLKLKLKKELNKNTGEKYIHIITGTSTVIGDISDIDESKVLKTLKTDHVYQNYLVGQIHSFNGELFMIKNIDEKSGIVSTQKEPLPDSLLYYRHINHVTYYAPDQFLESFHKKEIKNYVETKALYESEITINTSMYYTFTKGLNFNEGFTITQLDHNRKVHDRVYKHGRILEFNITNKTNDIFPAHKEISIILSFVFNELFKSVFPEYYQYIHATTLCLEKYDEKDKLVSLIPTIKIKKTKNSDLETNNSEKDVFHFNNAVSVLIIEDSTKDMGLVKAVYDNLDYLFMLIEDFLAWSIKKKQYFTHFILEDDSLLRNEGHIKQTWNILRELIDKDRTMLEMCDNCKNIIEGTYEYREGKKICTACLKYCVDTQKDLEYHLSSIKTWITDTYKVTIPQIDVIKFADAKIVKHKIAKQIRIEKWLQKISCHETDGSVTIIFIEQKPYTIKTYHLVIAAIAIEISLIWQEKNLDIEQFNNQYPGVLYYHAIWVAARYLHAGNNPQPTAKAYCQKLFNNSSFKQFENLLKSANESNPFVYLQNQCSKSNEKMIDNTDNKPKINKNKIVSAINGVLSFLRFKKNETSEDTKKGTTDTKSTNNPLDSATKEGG